MGGIDLQDRKVWIAAGTFAALIIGVATWMFAIHPMRSQASSLRAQNQTATAQGATLAREQAHLTELSRHISQYRSKLARAYQALPPGRPLAGFSADLTAAAERTDVELTSVAVSAPTPVTAALPDATTEPATTTDPAASSDSGTSTDPSTSSDPSTSDGSSTSTDTTGTAVPGTTSTTPSGPVAVTFDITAQGTLDHDLAFAQALRHGRRAALITSFQVTTGEGQKVTVTAEVSVFSTPASPAERARMLKLARPGN